MKYYLTECSYPKLGYDEEKYIVTRILGFDIYKKRVG